MHKRMLVIAAALVAALAGFAPAQAPNPNQKWGDLSGRFVYAGPVVVKPIVPANGLGLAAGPIRDESLVVNAENKGLANVIVWLFPAPGETVSVHPQYAAAAKEKVSLNQIGFRFDPHVVTLRTAQTLVVNNVDPVDHALKIEPFRSLTIMKVVPKGTSTEVEFDAEEPLPINAVCTIYSWMKARLVVKDHPYVAISDADGNFTLKNVPAGDRTFKVWHEANGYVKDINGAALKKGVWKVTVKEGANDTGKLTVALK